MKEPSAKKQPSYDSPDDYGAQLTELEPKFSSESLEARKEILVSEKPFIEKFEYADAFGFAVVEVNERDIVAKVFSGDDFDRVREISISDLLS